MAPPLRGARRRDPRSRDCPCPPRGTARVFCACCQDFLGKRLPGRNMALTPGYDEEGQRINARLRDPSPTARRKHRRHETQVHLENVLRTRALRTGVVKAAPLFLAS